MTIPAPETPMLDKMKSVQPESQLIGAFLEWMQEQGYEICSWRTVSSTYGEYVSENLTIEQVLAKYFGVDLKQASDEKDKIYAHMLAQIDANKVKTQEVQIENPCSDA